MLRQRLWLIFLDYDLLRVDKPMKSKSFRSAFCLMEGGVAMADDTVTCECGKHLMFGPFFGALGVTAAMVLSGE